MHSFSTGLSSIRQLSLDSVEKPAARAMRLDEVPIPARSGVVRFFADPDCSEGGCLIRRLLRQVLPDTRLTRACSCGELVFVSEREMQQESGSTPQNSDSVVSFQSELPAPLQRAMSSFIETHPNWDQYRLVQAALAGFLVQNGIESREITRVYVGNMFRRETLLHGV